MYQLLFELLYGMLFYGFFSCAFFIALVILVSHPLPYRAARPAKIEWAPVVHGDDAWLCFAGPQVDSLYKWCKEVKQRHEG